VAAYNHNLAYRPLRAGVAILNPIVNEIGTIGLIATSDGNDRWIVSCYHVLCRKNMGPAADNEPIFQPVDDADKLVAITSLQRSDSGQDCAAALVDPTIGCSGEILNVGRIGGLTEPTVGMRVIKSGCVTGVTEGVITTVNGDIVSIELPPSFPPQAELSQPGDSGCLWVARDSMKAVALHRTGSAFGTMSATAARISAVLQALQLRPFFL
jgi:hypothetical protein